MTEEEVLELSKKIHDLFFDPETNVSKFRVVEILQSLGVVVVNVSAATQKPYETLDVFIKQLVSWKKNGALKKTVEILQEQLKEKKE